MSKRHKREHGRILSVDEETLGTVLTADAAAGATTLTVDDAAEFEDDGTGGWLSINDQVIQYDTVDDDAGTIHLLTGLIAAADDGDPVYVWSKLYDTAATVKTALVMVDGEDDNTDPITATLAEAVQDLPEGLRGEAGESCTLLRVSDDEWEVTAVSGRPSSAKGVKFEANDAYVLTAADVTAASATIPLSHRPIDESVLGIWRTTPQEPTEYTVNYDAKTVTWPLSGFEQAGDRIWLHYAYRKGVAAAHIPDPPSFVAATSGTNASGDDITLTIPGTVQAGDLLVLVTGRSSSGADGYLSTPAGWTLANKVTGSDADMAAMWTKTATAGDAGSTVTVVSDNFSNIFGGAGASLAAYRAVTVKSITANLAGTNNQGASSPAVTAETGELLVGAFALSSSSGITTAAATSPSNTRAAATGQKGAALVVDLAPTANGAAAPAGAWTASNVYSWTLLLGSVS